MFIAKGIHVKCGSQILATRALRLCLYVNRQDANGNLNSRIFAPQGRKLIIYCFVGMWMSACGCAQNMYCNKMYCNKITVLAPHCFHRCHIRGLSYTNNTAPFRLIYTRSNNYTRIELK